MAFSWVPFYKEFAQKLLQFRNDRQPLIDWIYNNLGDYKINHLKDAPDGRRVADIDPFSVFALFNRGITHDKRIGICERFKEYLTLSSSVPQDFDGIPVMNTQRVNFMAFEEDRKEGDIERLWNVFEDAILDRNIEKSYNALNGQYLIRFNLTIGLFWICPDKYLPLDGKSQDLLNSLGIKFDRTKFLPYNEYERVMHELNEKMASESLGFSNYYEFSYAAYINSDKKQVQQEKKTYNSEITYWMYSPGENAKYWDENLEKGIMGIGWHEIGDLKQYKDRDGYVNILSERIEEEKNYAFVASMLYNFVYDMKPGDIVFAKKGRNQIVGKGIVTSDYYYDEQYGDHPNIRKVNWTHKGSWKTDFMQAMKTLTNITPYNDYVEKLNNLIEGNNKVAESYEQIGKQYWWLVANPKIWSLSNMGVGEKEEYTLYNSEGNKRKIFQNFLNAKESDIVIGYESSPTQQIVGLLEISRSNNGATIEFKKNEALPVPIKLSVLKNTPGLEGMEFMKNPQGSFFKVTSDEFDIIMDLIRNDNPLPKVEANEAYDSDKFLDEVFITKNEYDQLKNLLLRKKNLILQGAPGVGKTFAAKRLAYALMGEKNDDRVMQIQFHQSYSYEDFVMGYKPNEDGGFELKEGVFYRFCKKANADRDHKYFFIIDEINRGNMSKIFGELLMLIENGYRDKPIQLSYRDELFAVPENLYIIGMMNTADRSLAMIDYALRRRFSFFEMKPGFESDGFKKHIGEFKDSRLNKLVGAIIELNELIEKDPSLGTGFCIGHSYLCNLGNNYNLESIVEYDIIPMLREYWFDNDKEYDDQSEKLREALK